MTIGILAFQGDVIEHRRALDALDMNNQEVRSPEELTQTDALIIPGGESTVLAMFLRKTGLDTAIILRHRAEKFPIFGTCAGAILLSDLGLIDVDIERNAYGSQADSFEATIPLTLDGQEESLTGLFIRAPKVTRVGKGVEVLGRYKGEPVVYRQGLVLAATFHPELGEGKSVLHECFVELCLDPSASRPSPKPLPHRFVSHQSERKLERK